MMKLTKTNYYSQKANEEYMSYSQFKQFNECPAKAMAMLKGTWEEEKTDSMMIGSYVDSWLDGELDRFIIDNPDVFNSRTGELKHQFRQAEELCKVIKQDEYLYDQLKGKRQVIITGTIAGVKFKGKIDSLKKNAIIDGKVLKDCEDIRKDGERLPFYKANQYDIQAAIYTTLYKQTKNKKLPFRLAVVTKQKVPDKRIFQMSDQTIDDALQEILIKAPLFDKIKKGEEECFRCENCDYCKRTKNLSYNDIEFI